MGLQPKGNLDFSTIYSISPALAPLLKKVKPPKIPPATIKIFPIDLGILIFSVSLQQKRIFPDKNNPCVAIYFILRYESNMPCTDLFITFFGQNPENIRVLFAILQISLYCKSSIYVHYCNH